ncbi:aminodeoxychorismate lyase [Saccharomonospora xinjiangensis]|uniref:Branched-chain amino acid aminotransferase/4-amino-4-deoxychorismate lyase n=1 Tax=Saccharomonospora xinjiangensis XJ-54 TaxID=882086 RepID=I0V310_9PSEU|nr:aminodeoxychorismate lyase [Saccharomonospora xinjiangensis]EID54513.1 branched-chain amino acid aminotransferase/4-amino-4-deoxychorismate lyase [Saccharomonospora xinjiangensis XJ-54]
MRVLAFLDGTLGDPAQPYIRVDNTGVLRGDGIFETVLVVDGRPRELGPHLDRLARSAAMLDLPEPDLTAWEHAVQQVIDNWDGSPEIAVKLVYTRGSEGDPDAEPFCYALGMDIDDKVKRARAEGIAVVSLDRGFGPEVVERAPWLLLGAKTLSYAVNLAALREAARRGADDVVFTATDGSVLEGPTSTVVLAKGRTLYTPPPTVGILPGTTQRAVFRAAESAGWAVKIENIPADELLTADGLFLVSSVRKVTRVHTLDGTRLADSTAIHRELCDAYEAQY